jgi:hypothetical protein
MYLEQTTDFAFHNGFSIAQKRRSINSLHGSIRELFPSAKILEASSKSENPLGVSLSAFNLAIIYCGKRTSVESAFQGSKVFNNSGPFRELLDLAAWDAKKDPRLGNQGLTTGYLDQNGAFHPLGTDTHFYDMLYLRALSQNPELLKELSLFDTFTDIEFNKTKLGLQKAKSFNTQARACAIAVTIFRHGGLEGLKDQIEVWSKPIDLSEASPTLF